MASKKQLESKLTLQQRQAALLIVEAELGGPDTQKTQEQIADELGIARMTLYRWRTQNKAFIDYVNLIADDFLASQRSKVYRQLMKLIEGSQPSVKGIDLYLRRHGLLTDKTVVENKDAEQSRSNEDIAREIEELDDVLEEETE